MRALNGFGGILAGLCLSLTPISGWIMPAQAAPFCDTQRYTQAYVTKMICVDNYFYDPDGNAFDVVGLIDGKKTTAWCEGESYDGIGSTIKITLEASAPVLGIHIRNGYGRSLQHFNLHNRVKDLRLAAISYDADVEMRSAIITLRDEPSLQRIKMPWIVEDPRQIILEIVSVYQGDKYRDTCLSGLDLDFGM